MGDRIINEAVLREMQTGVLVIDGDGTVRYGNPYFKRSFPLTHGEGPKDTEDIRGINIFKAPGFKGLERAFKRFLGKSEEGLDIAEVSVGHRFLKVRFVTISNVGEGDELSVEPETGYSAEEGGSEYIVFLQDITEEKRLEAIKRDFVANVSHELRTPLASIKGYSETLLDGGLEEKETATDFLRIIDKHATRMSRLIDDLLILSRMESHEFEAVTGETDMEELIGSTVSALRKGALDKGIELLLDLPDSIPMVCGDMDRLEQVMVNLLDNAIKYTPSGGAITVSVGFESGGGEVAVKVQDTGLGIPKEDIPRIFERFYRVDKARSRELGGTGLGLAIVKHIIQGLNGKVSVESKVGKGSAFTFSLKRVQ